MTPLSPEVQALGLFVPEPVARRLLASGGRLHPVEAKATVLLQGDAILAVFNVPLADRDHGANALRAAIEIVRETDRRSFADV